MQIPFTSTQRAGLIFSILFWTITGIIWIYFFFALRSMRMYYAFSIALYVSLGYFFGGVEHAAIRLSKFMLHRHQSSI
jgi:hypothetical protein